MAAAKNNDTVQIHYTGSLDDGSVFDSSKGKEPLEFTLGAQQVIPGFEQGVLGMEVGETKTIHIPVDQAYGERRADLVIQVGLEQFPVSEPPEIGQQYELRIRAGQSVAARVAGVTDDDVLLDANHPLAGKDLNFDLELVAIL